MRLIDADELIEHVWRDRLDSRERIADLVKSMPSAQPVITCDGCKFVGTYDTDFPCRNCIRREKDYYAQE